MIEFCPLCHQPLPQSSDLAKLHMKRAQREILLILYNNTGRLVSYKTLLNGRGKSSLQSHIYFIRRAISDANLPFILESVHKRGYRLTRTDE